MTKIIDWLHNPDQMFGMNPEEGRNDFLKTTFQNALDRLKEELGDSIEAWQYGQENYKHVKLTHELSPLMNDRWKEKLNVGPLPTGGNSFTPNVTGSSDNMYHGASFRIIVDTGNWGSTIMINSPGQSGDSESPFYKNLFNMWADGNFFHSHFTRDKVENVTSEHIILNPTSKTKEN